MSPRRSASQVVLTRQAILAEAVNLSSTEGLESLSIAQIARAVEMSKSGVVGHFGTKESLQLAVVNRAVTVFQHEVIAPAASVPPGLLRLRALTANWVSYLDREVFPGGCFFTRAAGEVDDKKGPVRAAVVTANRAWKATLRRQISIAVAAGDLPPDTDPHQLVFDLVGVMLSLNQSIQLDRDSAAVDRARQSRAHLLSTQPGRRVSTSG